MRWVCLWAVPYVLHTDYEYLYDTADIRRSNQDLKSPDTAEYFKT